MKYLLQCRAISPSGVVKESGHKEGVGYIYENVIRSPTFEESQFKYAAVNNKTEMKVMEGEKITVTVDFRDWKYMSDIIRFQNTVDDADVLAGLKEGQLEIDFNQMTQSDIEKKTKYEVGGRLFFEAHAFSPAYTSFTTNAFLDKEGYVEPQASKSTGQVLLTWLPVVLGVLVAASLCLYFCCRRQKVVIEDDNNDYTVNLQKKNKSEIKK